MKQKQFPKSFLMKTHLKLGAPSTSFPHLTYQSWSFPEANNQRPEEKVGLTDHAHTDFLQYRTLR